MKNRDKFMDISEFITTIHNRQNEKKDVKIVISGWLGEGKSTLGYQLGKRISKDFTIPNNYIFEASEKKIVDKALELKKSTIIIDEAIDVLYKMDWASGLQNVLIKAFTQIRHRHNAIIMCIPQFTELRTSFRNYAIDYWIHVPRRGLAVLFGKTACTFDDDPWHMKENSKRFWASTKNISYRELKEDINKQVNLYERTLGCEGYFLFDPMPNNDQLEFDTLSEQAKERTMKSASRIKSVNYRKAMQRLGIALTLLNKKYHMTQEDIAGNLNIKREQVSVFMQNALEMEDILEVIPDAEVTANQNPQ